MELHALWQGGFYECLIGLVKQSLRKGVGCKLLYWVDAFVRS